MSSCILGWLQLELKNCPFDLLAGISEQSGAGGNPKSCYISQVQPKFRRRLFLLLAQFFEVNEYVELVSTCVHGQDSPFARGKFGLAAEDMGSIFGRLPLAVS